MHVRSGCGRARKTAGLIALSLPVLRTAADGRQASDLRTSLLEQSKVLSDVDVLRKSGNDLLNSLALRLAPNMSDDTLFRRSARSWHAGGDWRHSMLEKAQELSDWAARRNRTGETSTGFLSPSQRRLDPQNLDICVVNAFAAVFYLWEAGTSIAAAERFCADPEDCAVSVLATIQTLLASGSFIAGLADVCASTPNIPAACAATVIGLVGALPAVAQGITAMVDSCDLNVRRLQEDDGAPVIDGKPIASEDAPLFLSFCVLNVVSVPLYVAQAYNHIRLSVDSCPVQNLQSEKSACAADVSAVLASIGNIAAYASAIATSCTLTVNFGANCAANAGLLVNAFAAIASSGAALVNTCQVVDTPPEKRPPVPAGFGVPAGFTVSFDPNNTFPNATNLGSNSTVVR